MHEWLAITVAAARPECVHRACAQQSTLYQDLITTSLMLGISLINTHSDAIYNYILISYSLFSVCIETLTIVATSTTL